MHFYAHLSYVCLQLHICTNICFSFTFVLVLSYFYGLPCMQRPAFMQTSFYWNTNTTGFHTNYTWTCISGSACSHCVTNQKKRGTWENTYIATGNFIYACLICVNQTFLFHHTKPDYDCALCAAQNLKPLRGAPGMSEWELGSRKKERGKKVDSEKNEKLSAAIRRPSDSIGLPSSWGVGGVSLYWPPVSKSARIS